MPYHSTQSHVSSTRERPAHTSSPRQDPSSAYAPEDTRHFNYPTSGSVPRPFADAPAAQRSSTSASSSPGTSYRALRPDPVMNSPSHSASRPRKHSRSGSVSTGSDLADYGAPLHASPSQTSPVYRLNHNRSAPSSASSLQDPYTPLQPPFKPSVSSEVGRPVPMDMKRLMSRPAPVFNEISSSKSTNVSRQLDAMAPKFPVLPLSRPSEPSQNRGTSRAEDAHDRRNGGHEERRRKERPKGFLASNAGAAASEQRLSPHSDSSREPSPNRQLKLPLGEKNRPTSEFREMQDALFGGRHVTGPLVSSDHVSGGSQEDELPQPTSPTATRTRTLLKRKPSVNRGATSAVSTESVFGQHSHRVESSGPPLSPTTVTPAGAVLQAYKERERQGRQQQKPSLNSRSHVSESDGFLPARQDWETASAQGSQISERDPAMPFYTVFGGGKSGRIVAVGTPADGSYKVDPISQERSKSLKHEMRKRSMSPALRQPPSSGQGAGGLVRKVSGRWRRNGATSEGGHDATDAAYGGMETPDTRSRQSLQHERRSATLPRHRPNSLRLSMDGGVGGDDVPHSSQSITSSWVDVPASAEKNRGRTEKRRDRMSEEVGGASTGGKLWRLVKRLSSGTLKDKYQADADAPPVPALPKELQTSSRGQLEPANMLNRGFEEKEIPSRPPNRSVSASFTEKKQRPSTAPHRSTSGVAVPSDRPSTSQGSPLEIAPPRRSTTTQESSSSPTTDSHLFHNQHSDRSSVSSYGHEMHRLPVGNRIMSPSEVFDFDKAQEQRRLTQHGLSNGTTSVGTPGAPQSLPPPRRSPTTTASRSVRTNARTEPPSPTMPVFSIQGTVNTRIPQRSQTISLSKKNAESADAEVGERNRQTSPSHHRSMPPPPRPTRSPHRPLLNKPVPPLVIPDVPFPSRPSEDNDHSRRDGAPRGPRARASSHTQRSSPSHPNPKPRTPKASRSSPSQSGILTTPLSAFPPLNGTPMNFRRLDASTPRAALSEQEKADKWDTLLEMSARAGGTLHVGGEDGLLSDNYRLSQISGVSGITVTD